MSTSMTSLPSTTRRQALRLGLGLPLAAALAGTLSACVTHERVVVQADVGPQVRRMPAPIHEDRGYAPAPGWSWVPGHWRWEGRDWFWVQGHWVQQVVPPMPPVVVEQITMAPSPHHYWVPGHWTWQLEGGGRWFWVGGRWRS